MAQPLAVAAFGLAGLLTPYDNGPFPNMPVFPDEPRVEQLYKDGGAFVGRSVLNPAAADQACPAGFEVARQGMREEGPRTYLVWTLRCR